MPVFESHPVKVTLTIEVDGHTLTFIETGKAMGARYHGADPRALGYRTSDTLESQIRQTVEECVTEVGDRAEMFLSRAYLTCDDLISDEVPESGAAHPEALPAPHPGESTDAPHRS